MSGIRLELANPNAYGSPKEYIEQHLVPIATELHRLANELVAPGASAEEHAVDMVPTIPASQRFVRLDRRLVEEPKHVVFDGAEYFSVPKEVLRAKQAKVQFSATLFVQLDGDAKFRLVRDDGMVIENSLIPVSGSNPQTYTRVLPFGDQKGSVSPDRRTYFIEAGRFDTFSIPVCRRFSLSFVYI